LPGRLLISGTQILALALMPQSRARMREQEARERE